MQLFWKKKKQERKKIFGKRNLTSWCDSSLSMLKWHFNRLSVLVWFVYRLIAFPPSSLALTSAGASCAAKTLARAEIFVVTRKEYAHIRTKGNKRKVEVEVEGKAEEENGLPGIAPR